MKLKSKFSIPILALAMASACSFASLAAPTSLDSYISIEAGQQNNLINVEGVLVEAPWEENDGTERQLPDAEKQRLQKEINQKFKDTYAINPGTNSPGITYNGDYYVKVIAQRGFFRRGDSTQGMIIPGRQKFNAVPYRLTFRYLGYIGSGNLPATNPAFLSDTIKTGSNPVPQYGRDNTDKVVGTVKISYSDEQLRNAREYWPLQELKGAMGSGINSSIEGKKEINKDPELARKVFEAWAQQSEEGYFWKQSVIGEGYTEDNWWSVLNEYMQIRGTRDDVQQNRFSSVYLITRHRVPTSKKVYYRTFMIPAAANINAFPNQLSIYDENGNAYVTASRSADSTVNYLYSGATHQHNTDDKDYALIPNGKVKIDASIESIAKEGKSSNESKDNISFIISTYSQTQGVSGGVAWWSPRNNHDLVQIKGRTIASEHGRTTGYIGGDTSTSALGSSAVSMPHSTSDGGEDMVYGSFALGINEIDLSTLNLKTDTDYTLTVKLGSTPSSWGIGSNDIKIDDSLSIHFRITDEIVIPSTTQALNYTNMNLGAKEGRILHWMEEAPEEEDEDEEGDDGDSGDSDDGGGEEEEKEPKFLHKWSEVGKWENESDAKAHEDGSEEWDEGLYPENANADPNGRYWKAEGDYTWWEYVNSGANGGGYEAALSGQDDVIKMNSDGGNLFYRDELSDFDPTISFTTKLANSRGVHTIDSPTVEYRIYGESPDSGGWVLLRELNNATDASLASKGVEPSNFFTTGTALSPYSEGTNTSPEKRIGNQSSGVNEHDSYWPKIKVVANIASDLHGNSGFFDNGSAVDPKQNAWEPDFDVFEREYDAASDDMYISELWIKDSEGIMIYHASRTTNDVPMDQHVPANNGTPVFDREEDYVMTVKVKQNESSNHIIKHPTIDVRVEALHNGETYTTSYLNTPVPNGTVPNGYTEQMDETGNEPTIYEIPFRAYDIHGNQVYINVRIDELHEEWRENKWNTIDDEVDVTLTTTTANLGFTQDIEVYNSKNNKQDYLTFAEYLKFRFEILHLGRKNEPDEQMVVGNTKQNPNATMYWEVFNADQLTVDPATKQIKYDNTRMLNGKWFSLGIKNGGAGPPFFHAFRLLPVA